MIFIGNDGPIPLSFLGSAAFTNSYDFYYNMYSYPYLAVVISHAKQTNSGSASFSDANPSGFTFVDSMSQGTTTQYYCNIYYRWLTSRGSPTTTFITSTNGTSVVSRGLVMAFSGGNTTISNVLSSKLAGTNSKTVSTIASSGQTVPQLLIGTSFKANQTGALTMTPAADTTFNPVNQGGLYSEWCYKIQNTAASTLDLTATSYSGLPTGAMAVAFGG